MDAHESKKKYCREYMARRKAEYERQGLCNICGKVPPTLSFKRCDACRKYTKSRTRSWITARAEAGYCRSCGKNWPVPGLRQCDACKQRDRSRALRLNYGIDSEEYERMLEKQHGLCAICKSPEPKAKGKHFVVDHCHTTGRVRGLLCGQCNTALARLGDDLESIKRVVSYLTGS